MVRMLLRIIFAQINHPLVVGSILLIQRPLVSYLMKAVQLISASNGVPYIQMTSVGSHSKSGRKKERGKGSIEPWATPSPQNHAILAVPSYFFIRVPSQSQLS